MFQFTRGLHAFDHYPYHLTSIHISHEILQEPLQVLMWVIKVRRLVHLNPRCSRKSIFIGFDSRTRMVDPFQTSRIVPGISKKHSQASIRLNIGLPVLAHLHSRLASHTMRSLDFRPLPLELVPPSCQPESDPPGRLVAEPRLGEG